MTTVDDRAKPMRHRGKSETHRKVEEIAMGYLHSSPAIVEAIQSGHFSEARRMLRDESSLSAKKLAFVGQWIRLERAYRNTPLPS